MSRVAAGDRDAFTEVVRRHAPAVMRVARAIAGDDARADDVAQEAFVAAMESARTYRADLGSVRAWLLTIARNKARRARRAKPEELRAEWDDAPLFDLGLRAGWGDDAPDVSFEREEESERLARALASLADEEREIIALRDVEELSGEETARVLGVTVAAMKSRLHRARLRMLGAVREIGASVKEREREAGGIRCGEVLARLGDYVDGELPPADVSRVEAHLRGCEVCERFGGRYSRAVQAARTALGASPTYDTALVEAVRARLASG